MTALDAAHDPHLRSWVDTANVAGCDFPIQNLPVGRFRQAGSTESWRIGTAIGDQVLALRAVALIDTDDMNALMAAAPSERRALRARIAAGPREGSAEQAAWTNALLPQAQAEYPRPCASAITPVRLSHSRAAQAAYWTAAQLIAHHTVNGCNLQPGDLLGSGTLSAPSADQAGSLLELTQGGTKPLKLPNGEKRAFLEDGDTLILRGYCEAEGAVRIGLGEASGTILTALDASR
jgi:hypothetical protein